MLNELWRLAEALKVAGLEVPANNPRVSIPGKSSGKCLRVRLAADGGVSAVEEITDDEWPGLWTVREGNQNSFPVSRLSLEPEASQLTARSQALISRLAKKAAELHLIAADVARLSGVREMTERFITAAENSGRLRAELLARLDDPGAKVQLAFDAENSTIYRIKTRAEVGRRLAVDSSGNEDHPGEACAFSGNPDDLRTQPFPKVRLPVLRGQDVPLVSMFSDARCNYRYGLSDAMAVPVSTESALRMQDALTFIVSEERRDKTWRGVASGLFRTTGGRTFEVPDLLIVYVDGRPDLPVEVAKLLGSGTDRQFEVDASAVCKALEGISRQHPESRMNLFTIRQVSEGQAQTQVQLSLPTDQVVAAAQTWEVGTQNLPALPWVGEEPKSYRPDQIVRVTSRQWLDAGQRYSPSRGASLGQVLTVMLRLHGHEQVARDLLSLTLGRSGPLLVGLFGGLHRDGDRNRFSGEARTHALLTARGMAVLLHTLGHSKEGYMETAPFLVGRWLQLVDLLQREYHLRPRGKEESGDPKPQLPPQLLGNALLPVAHDSLDAAFARLTLRMKVYQGWANVSGSPLSRWALGQMGQVALDLAPLDRTKKMDDAARAELLLGYMARIHGSKENEEAGAQPTSDDNGGSNG